jgi:hypothetical protein
LTGAIWIGCDAIGLSTWASAGISLVIGFTLRVAALYRAWEPPPGQRAIRGLQARRRAPDARTEAEGQVGSRAARPRLDRRGQDRLTQSPA